MKFTQKAIDHINSIESADERVQFSNMLSLAANRFAKKHGYGKTTLIDIRKDSQCKVIKTVPFGYVKDSTGEYVPKSYVNKCYGKGVSYVSAEFKCQIGIKDLWLKA
jgi:hypothetical protein